MSCRKPTSQSSKPAAKKAAFVFCCQTFLSVGSYSNFTQELKKANDLQFAVYEARLGPQMSEEKEVKRKPNRSKTQSPKGNRIGGSLPAVGSTESDVNMEGPAPIQRSAPSSPKGSLDDKKSIGDAEGGDRTIRSRSTPPPSRHRNKQLWGVKLRPIKDAPTVPEGREGEDGSQPVISHPLVRHKPSLGHIDQPHPIEKGMINPLPKPALRPLEGASFEAKTMENNLLPFPPVGGVNNNKLPKISETSNTPR